MVLALPIGLPRVAQAYGNEFGAALLLMIGLGLGLRAEWRTAAARGREREVPAAGRSNLAA